MRILAKNGCSITLVRGDRDHTLERELYEDREDGVDLLECARAGHQLPLTQPEWCVELLENVMTGTVAIEPASPPTA
jgi:hypothetical protein